MSMAFRVFECKDRHYGVKTPYSMCTGTLAPLLTAQTGTIVNGIDEKCHNFTTPEH
jgi:hypothetical protein